MDNVFISDFVTDLKKAADLFECFWEKAHQQWPEEFPLHLNSDLWHEQFAIFVSCNERCAPCSPEECKFSRPRMPIKIRE